MEDTPREQQTKIESNKSNRRQHAGQSYCTTTNVSSDNNFNAKTLIEYNIDKTLDIKEEIDADQEIQEWEKHNFRRERNQVDEKCIFTEILSDNNSRVKTTIEYDNDETLEIKEESVQDHGNMDQRLNKKHQSKLYTLGTREADIVTVKEPRTSKKKKHQEPKAEPENKYECEKCARSYAHKRSLYRHKKYQCGVTPQFSCEFCGKLFKLKVVMREHILRVHQKPSSNVSQMRHNCKKCSRSYSTISALNIHKRAEHAVVKPQFICDYCGFQTKQKKNLPPHITSRH